MKTNIYIDGFNLYYGALIKTSYKWLNLDLLCRNLFKKIQINRIRYFTADVKGLPHDPGAPLRQSTYLRALKTLTNVEIIKGNFVAWPKLMPQFPLAYIDGNNPPQKPPQKVQVQKREEKGSDVNLATYLLVDCFENNYEQAIIFTNDSDLALPIELVIRKYKKPVIVVNPHKDQKPAWNLKQSASAYINNVNPKLLAVSQFDSILTDARGTFSKPPSW